MALTQVSSGGIKDGSITNADLNSSASIAGSKVSPDFGSQNVVTTGTVTGAALIPSGSSVPANGIYLSATNTLGLSSNSIGRLFIDANGVIKQGLNAEPPGFVSLGYVASTNTASGSVFTGYKVTDSAGNSAGVSLVRARGTVASPTSVQAEDALGSIVFYGHDGTTTRSLGQIQSRVQAIAGTDNASGYLTFLTRPSGVSSILLERLRVHSTGNVSIGTTASNARLHIRDDDASGNGRAILQATDQRLVFTSRWVAGVEQYSSINSTNDAESTGNYLYINSNKGRVGIGAAPVSNAQLAVVNDRNVSATYYNYLATTWNGTTFENDFAIYFNGATEIIGNYQNWPLAFMTNNQERMRIRADGQIAIGGAGGSNVKVDIRGNLLLTGNPGTVYGMVNGPNVLPGTNSVFINYSEFNYADNGGTTYSIPGTVDGFATAQGYVSPNLSTIAQQRGFFCTNLNKAQTNIGFVCSDFTLGTNSNKAGYSFYGAINKEVGCDKYNLYLPGSAPNYFAGTLGLRGGATDNVSVYMTGSSPRHTDAWGVYGGHQVTKEVDRYRAFEANITTEAVSAGEAYSCDTYGFISLAGVAGVGANSTISNHYSFYAGNDNAATTNISFYSSNSSAAGKNNWNHFQAGTAPNYLEAQLRIHRTDFLSDNHAIQAFKTSGSCVIYNRSDTLANGQVVNLVNFGGSRYSEFGVFKHSGITNPAGYTRMDRTDATACFLWFDTSNNLRTSGATTDIGLPQGTVVGTQTSDLRLKNISGPIEYGLEAVKQIEPVRYSLKTEPDTTKIGFIAQEIAEIIPEAVYDTKEVLEGYEDGPTKLAMEYVALIPVLVNAIKELSAKNEELEARLSALEA